jgi:hypothetical protein
LSIDESCGCVVDFDRVPSWVGLECLTSACNHAGATAFEAQDREGVIGADYRRGEFEV